MPPETSDRLRVLIVDDEAPARSRLRRMLAAESDVEVLAECASGQQAVTAIRQLHPDLVFLDIQMPRLNGLEVCRELASETLPLIIFVTAYDRYALEAFEVHAVDYLLKPFDQERFARALNHARQRWRRSEASDAQRQILAALQNLRSSAPQTERLVFKANGRVVFLRFADLDYIEADGNYAKVHAAASIHLVRETMNALETQLPPERFLRISRSVIVNLDRVKEVQPLFYGDHVVILRDGTQLNLTRNYRDKLEALLVRPPGLP